MLETNYNPFEEEILGTDSGHELFSESEPDDDEE